MTRLFQVVRLETTPTRQAAFEAEVSAGNLRHVRLLSLHGPQAYFELPQPWILDKHKNLLALIYYGEPQIPAPIEKVAFPTKSLQGLEEVIVVACKMTTRQALGILQLKSLDKLSVINCLVLSPAPGDGFSASTSSVRELNLVNSPGALSVIAAPSLARLEKLVVLTSEHECQLCSPYLRFPALKHLSTAACLVPILFRPQPALDGKPAFLTSLQTLHLHIVSVEGTWHVSEWWLVSPGSEELVTIFNLATNLQILHLYIGEHPLSHLPEIIRSIKAILPRLAVSMSILDGRPVEPSEPYLAMGISLIDAHSEGWADIASFSGET